MRILSQLKNTFEETNSEYSLMGNWMIEKGERLLQRLTTEFPADPGQDFTHKSTVATGGNNPNAH